MSTISYSPIGKSITMRADLSALSGRDKAELLRTLLEEGGVIGDLVRNSEAEKIIAKAYQALWGK